MSVQPFVKPTSELDRRSLGKYELLCRLSTGGMSEIFLATQRGLAGFRKIVVLKSILPDIRGEDEFVKMFLEEARTTAAFNHPNIAQVFDLDTDDGTLFLVMEFVQGATLVEMARACRQAKEPIPLGFTLAAVRDTALALHYAHTFTDPRGRRQVVIHRDVAEKNIMVSYEGTTKLLDFGIAKALGRRSGSMTSIGMVKGTSGYMSPEQIRGEPLDPRSDVFALGVVLHECLTGMRLFHGKNAEDGMLAALREEVQPPSRLSPEVNAALDAVTLKALARDRDARFATSLEFARAIEKACPGQLWHAEQSGELVQRFYNERRQQTRDLVEQAQGGQELTGELKLDRVLAAVRNPLQSVGPPPPPVNTGEISVVTPALPQPRRKTEAITTAIPPVRAKPGVAPRASGEKPQLTTDPAGIDIRISRAPVQSVGPGPREETEMARGGPPEFSEPPVRTNPGEFPFNDDDDDDPGAKTIPATSLPADMLAQIRANRARIDAKTDAVPIRTPITEALPPAMAVRHSNVILEPVTSDGRSVTAETQSNGVAPSRQPPPPAAKLDPFADIVDEPEPGLKTAIGRPFDTHADEEEPEESPFDSGDPGPEPNTNTGVGPSRGIGKFIGIGVGLAVCALAGALYFLRLGPFSEGQLGPPPAERIPGITPPKPAAGEAKADAKEPKEAKDPKAKAPEPKAAEPKPAEAKAPEPKPEAVAVKPPPPEPPKATEPAPEPKKPEPAKAPPPRKPAREPPPPRKAKAAPEPKNNDVPVLLGSLSLVVDPPVHVFFQGKDLGTTPLKANLPIGKQTLKLVPAAGAAKTVTVDVKEAGGAARYDLEDL